MSEKLVITLDEDITKKYLAEAAKKTQAEINADCLPSGASLRIDICSPFGNLLYLNVNGEWEEIGEVVVDLKAI
ncbi:hypothetical protein [Thiocystis violacea]|uniref:hypothetical protein n=1 Tax=Thiocystis violacea TaxID=13725 RepID=UPI0019047C12|nr:hypothetical protein [Thiocystis violacea]